MIKRIMLSLALVLAVQLIQAQEYKIITTVESVVPGGLGRSRLIDNKEKVDYRRFTTSRESGKDSDQGKVDRSEAKIDNMEETKLLNFYSMVGINFQNIASNDAIITSKINAMVAEGWDLAFVISGVESDAGKDDGKGLFITRYVFKRMK
jgi:hypothetical protein